MGKTAEAGSDAGLGLEGFLASSPPVVEGDASPSQSDTVVAEPKKEEGAAPEKTVETPVKDPVGEAAKIEPVVKVEPEKPAINWDADDNPYKKRYADTAQWATTINQKLAALSKSQDIVGKKIDGTYDPVVDDVPAPSPDEIATNATLAGKVEASEALAKEFYDGKYGQGYVDRTLNEFNAEFGRNSAIQGRVLSSPAPIVEAIKVMRERTFYAEYGNDPDAITKTIREKLEKELRPKIAEEEAKRLSDRLTKRDETPTGLAGARGTGDQTPGKQTGPTPLKSIFGA
jgi:hypothetical protein